jgi:hypothetical protein
MCVDSKTLGYGEFDSRIATIYGSHSQSLEAPWWQRRHRSARRKSHAATVSQHLDESPAVTDIHRCPPSHGTSGAGDGPDGKNRSPRPANIAAVSKMPMASDGYLLWAISEGGVPIRSAMPPFGETLKEDEIWKITTYLRVL